MGVRTQLCIEQMSKCLHLAGDVVEFGVSMGTTTFPLAREATNKLVYAFDTFEGIPYDDEIKQDEKYVKKGECRGYNVIKFIEKAKEENCLNIVIVKGLFEDTTKITDIKDICFAWLDADVYQATKVAWEYVEKRLVIQGIVGFHDYTFSRCPGVKKVVDTIDREKFEVIRFQSNCVFLRRIK